MKSFIKTFVFKSLLEKAIQAEEQAYRLSGFFEYLKEKTFPGFLPAEQPCHGVDAGEIGVSRVRPGNDGKVYPVCQGQCEAEHFCSAYDKHLFSRHPGFRFFQCVLQGWNHKHIVPGIPVNTSG